jgi:hypothetical protein
MNSAPAIKLRSWPLSLGVMPVGRFFGHLRKYYNKSALRKEYTFFLKYACGFVDFICLGVSKKIQYFTVSAKFYFRRRKMFFYLLIVDSRCVRGLHP